MKVYVLGMAALLIGYSAIELKFVSPGLSPDSGWCRAWFCQGDHETLREYRELLESGLKQVPASARGFSEILRIDPASSLRWCDWAEAMVESAAIDQARYGIERAIVLAPRNSLVLLRVVNFYLRINDVARALQYAKVILNQVPDYDAILFNAWDRFEIPNSTILEDGLPVDRRATRSYLSHLLGTGRITDARATWKWTREHSFDDALLAADYFRFLLRNHVFQVAQAEWVDYLGQAGGDFPRSNRIFNGDFEKQSSGSPFDWTIGTSDGVKVTRDSSSTYSGQDALHLEFAGTTNVALSQVSQTVVLDPGRYRLEYFVKTAGITTNEGVHLRILDSQNPVSLDELTEPTSGTTEWHRVEHTFQVSSSTPVIQVQVVRNPSRKFDNKIAGSAWIDSIKLSRAGS